MNFDPSKATVYVVGAGASKPYGFPLGGELKGYMWDKMGEIHPGLERADEPEPYGVLNKLRACSGDTVDDDIVKLPLTDERMARRIMVKALVNVERGMTHNKVSINWGKDFPDGWYVHFFRLLRLAESDPKVKIISFNYERSLQFFLGDFPEKEAPRDKQAEVSERAKRVKFIHPYGWVGPLEAFGFGDIYHLEGAEDNVTLIHDNNGNTKGFDDGNSALKEAEQVVFIGFGFNRKSVDRLFADIDTTDGSKRYWTTSVGYIDRDYLRRRFADISLAEGDRTASELMNALRAEE